MPDLRYHLISLISVFLALAIGILLGVAMADRGVVSDRMEAQITDVQNRFTQQQERISDRDREIRSLRERTTSDEGVMSGMADGIVSGRLIGLEVAVVVGPYASTDAAGSVEDTLKDAGANVTSVTQLPSPNSPSELTSLEATTPLQGDYSSTARSVFSDAGDYDTPPQAVVFVGGGRVPRDAPNGTLEALNEAESDMFGVWLDRGMRVVGAQPSETRRSEVELFQSLGIASVDNVSTSAGRAGVVQLLGTDDDGSYGTRDTATDPFPPPSR